MTDEFDLVGMFEGMTPTQTRELTGRIKSAVRREIEKYKQGDSTMNVLDLAADLTPEETRDLLKRLAEKRGLAEPTDDPGEAAIRQEAEEKVKAYRQQKDLAPLIESYKREMLSARGKGRIVGDRIKAKYRAQGVPVETIQFSV